MPYVDRDLRPQFDELVKNLEVTSAGFLNYCITKLCLKYLKTSYRPSYSDLNVVVGVLECAKLEFARQKLYPYEDIKKDQNGPVTAD